MRFKKLCVIGFILLLSSLLMGGSFGQPGAFLRFGASARSLAMGGAYSVLANNGEARRTRRSRKMGTNNHSRSIVPRFEIRIRVLCLSCPEYRQFWSRTCRYGRVEIRRQRRVQPRYERIWHARPRCYSGIWEMVLG